MNKYVMKRPEGKNLLLQAVNIHKSYGTKENPVQVLRRVNLEITPGEMLAVVGASGSGKTTLLQILGSLDVPDKGEIWFDGQGLNELSENRLATHRNKNIGFIFQFHYLLPEFSALENVMMPGLIAGLPMKQLEEDAHRLLTLVGLGHRVQHRSGELSGGEQQRVALARALIMQPVLLLADEPTGNLDSASGQQVFALLTELCQTRSMSVVMVTHNMELAGAMDRCLTLKDGSLE
ncbi:lipoprotein-releasing system ATP-binding protein [Candidatus Electrothrix aarhusensis]|jgi:lipoprotein-releasing system ATP-binding protein|uniref:Lipoprotein-releasing system ATP-binding protein n=1 Tax=Candidatus Electrothrix aarhusensis TaxID=1859131 RepID=A0A444IST6_9BACT|nr:lipoprotein-releasing system ATP-binding protein [Candidatus Electrothrix aarhusensis]